MRVCLVQPPPFGSERWMRIGRIQEAAVPNVKVYFPVFLAHTAAILREAGHTVCVFDAVAQELSLLSIKKKMSRFNPDAVMVETIPITFKGDIRIADLAKEIDQEIYTIYFGLLPTARPRDVTSIRTVDFAVRREPEITSLDLINTLENDGDLRRVKGITYKENGVIKQNSDRPLVDNLDSLPYPARDLFPLEKYVMEPLGKMTVVTASRGCPYSCCVFCASNLMDGKKLRSRHPKNVAEEIESIVQRHNIRTISFYSCNFCLWKDRNIVEFCKELSDRKLDVRWLVNSRVDTLPSENTLRHMAKSGCFLIQFGVESGSLRMIKAMHKGRNIKECERYERAIVPAIEKVKSAGIFTHTEMLMGLPGENAETIGQSVDLIKKAGSDLPVNFMMAFPIPGTPLGRMAEQKGLFPPLGKDWSWYDHRKIAFQLSAIVNNTTPEEIIKLRTMGNNAVRFSLIQKLRMPMKLLRRRDFDIILNMIKLAIKEGTDMYKMRWSESDIPKKLIDYTYARGELK